MLTIAAEAESDHVGMSAPAFEYQSFGRADRLDVGNGTMNVPLLDLQSQYRTIRDRVREAIDRVCDAQHFIMGSEVAGLESEIAAYCGAGYAVGVSSGTDALLAALMAVNIGKDDEVITTSYSFFATAGVIARLGALPVFVDINPDTFNLDESQLAQRITPRTKAILPVHLFGRCAAMNTVLELARQHGLAVIEDAAQAIGAVDEQGRSAGTIGDVGCFSFFPSKNLGAFGDAGMVVTNDRVLAEKVRMLRVHGSKPKYHHRIVGGNFRLDALQAAVLRVKLPYLAEWTNARRKNAERYRELCRDLGVNDVVILPGDVPGHIYNQFVIRTSRRDELQAFLSACGVATEVYYPIPLHLQECFAGLGWLPGDLPNAERAAKETLALPIYPELSSRQQEYIVRTVSRFFYPDHAS